MYQGRLMRAARRFRGFSVGMRAGLGDEILGGECGDYLDPKSM